MPIGGGSAAAITGAIKPGMFVYVAHANDPGDNAGDYLECNGQNVSRSTYAALFAKIGVVWGIGDGVTTFTLPDARRRSPVGKGGAGTATLGNAVGNTGGEENHTQIVAEIAAHSHTDTFPGDNLIIYQRGSGGVYDLGPGSAADREAFQTNNTGSSTPFNVYHPAFICGVWIKT